MATEPTAGAIRYARAVPLPRVTRGVTRISTGVFLLTSLPSWAATMAIISTARGPPPPPREFAAVPTAVREKSTRGGAFNA